ncbi:MAG: peptidoglycan bridge formation glycyltransferase FemA/FemB family protein [Candidatus Gottesmanbacteria bacterium]
MNEPTVSIRPATMDDQKRWNPNIHHPLQTWEWGEFRKQMGVDVVRMIVQRDNKISGCWQMTFHKIPFSPFTIGYFPKGPMPDQFMIQELNKIGKQKNAIYIQLEPNIISNYELPARNASHSDVGGRTTNHELLPSHHPLFTKYTFVLDLTKSEEELLKTMHNKTRYNIKVAEKHGVVVKEDNSKEAFDTYLKLNEDTLQRQGFYAHNKTYHETMWRNLSKSGIAKLWTASYQGTILATWILFVFEDTIYYPYGASSRVHREVMAPNLLLWEIVQWGKKNGYKKFDLWGAMGPDPDPKDPWYGFHRFKEGYHPALIEFVGSFDLVINPFLYKLYCLGDTIRWTFLKYKTKL